MSFARLPLSSAEWTRISSESEFVTFQNVGSRPIYVNFTSGESPPTEDVGLIYPQYQGEVRRKVDSMSVMGGLSVWAKAISGSSSIVVFQGEFADIEEPEEPEDPEEPIFLRTASDETTISIHSGHSLTDSYISAGEWPGYFNDVLSSIFGPGWGGFNVARKETIPGSPMRWRWNEGNALGTYPWADNDTLMITEGGPIPHFLENDPTSSMNETLDYMCRFAAQQIEHGRSNEIILWTIWTTYLLDNLEPGSAGDWEKWTSYTFRESLDEYGKLFRYISDYATWKMKSLYELPEDWRVWIFPGHALIARVYDDIQLNLVPGIDTIADCFSDDIHSNEILGYGLACFVITMFYQMDLREAEDPVFIPGTVTQQQAEYFWRVSWEIASSYYPCGMGGTEYVEPEFDPLTMDDPWPNWTVEDPDPVDPGEPGEDEVPEWVNSYDPVTGYVGNTPDEPFVIEDGLILLDENSLGHEIELALPNTRYMIMAFRPGSRPETGSARYNVVSLGRVGGTGTRGSISIYYNTYVNPQHIGVIAYDTGSDNNEEYSVGMKEEGGWEIFEAWVDVDESYMSLDGTAVRNTPGWESGPIVDVGTSNYLKFVRSEWEAGVANAPDGHQIEIAAYGIFDQIPSAEGRAAARVWAASHIPT